MAAAREIQPGQTVLCNGTPSLVWRLGTTPKGHATLTFLVPNADNVVQWIVDPEEPVEVAPLARM